MGPNQYYSILPVSIYSRIIQLPFIVLLLKAIFKMFFKIYNNISVCDCSHTRIITSSIYFPPQKTKKFCWLTFLSVQNQAVGPGEYVFHKDKFVVSKIIY